MTMKGTKEQRVVSDGYSARLDLTASVVEQMGLHAAQPGVPRFSSVVPVLRAARSRRRTFGVVVLPCLGDVGVFSQTDSIC